MTQSQTVDDITKNILSSRQNFNDITLLLDMCQGDNARTANKAVVAMCHVYATLRTSPITTVRKSGDARYVLSEWINASFKLFVKFLLDAYATPEPLLQVCLLFLLVIQERRYGRIAFLGKERKPTDFFEPEELEFRLPVFRKVR